LAHVPIPHKAQGAPRAIATLALQRKSHADQFALVTFVMHFFTKLGDLVHDYVTSPFL